MEVFLHELSVTQNSNKMFLILKKIILNHDCYISFIAVMLIN